jgi:hypothetical protein
VCLVPKRSTTRESGRRAVVGKKRRNNQTETEFTKVEQQNRRERERERERENWAQSNKIKQNFTKVCMCKFFNSRKNKIKSQKQLHSIHKHPNNNRNYITFINIPKNQEQQELTTPTIRKTISKRKTGEAKKKLKEKTKSQQLV